MKNLLKISALLAMVAILIMGCNRTVDPVHGTVPVDISFWEGTSENTYFPLDVFRQLGEANDTAAQRAMVNEYREILTTNVVNHYPQITDEKNIHFVLGSGFAKDVKSGDGKTYSGNFKNELIIIIDDPAVKDTVFLACGNGMLSPLEFSEYSDFGTAKKWRFTIQPGEGLAHHLPELQAWAEVANSLSIPIKDKDGNIVSQEKYLNFLGRYESLLFPYDVIDLIAGKVYNKAGQEVQFDRRMEETAKANAKKTNKSHK